MADVRAASTQNVTVYDEAGNIIGVTANPMAVAPKPVAVTGSPVTVTNTGQTTVYTPTSGSRIRLKWLGMKTAADATETVVTVRLGATIIYVWPMGAPDVFSHTSIREGATNAVLTVELSVASSVYVNLDVEEFI